MKLNRLCVRAGRAYNVELLYDFHLSLINFREYKGTMKKKKIVAKTCNFNGKLFFFLFTMDVSIVNYEKNVKFKLFLAINETDVHTLLCMKMFFMHASNSR